MKINISGGNRIIPLKKEGGVNIYLVPQDQTERLVAVPTRMLSDEDFIVAKLCGNIGYFPFRGAVVWVFFEDEKEAYRVRERATNDENPYL